MAPEMGVRRVTTTDGDGRYEFAELPAGRFTLPVTKAGFFTLQYGQRRPTEPGTPVVLVDGAVSEGLDMALPRGSVIAGRLADEFGEPIASAQVQAQRYQYQPDGQRRLMPMGFAQSDDLGTFRLYGLMPGEYVVSASVRAPMMIATGGGPTMDPNEGFAPTFYPGTPMANEAQAVNLALGQEASIQFSLLAARLARVTGTVADSSGRPVSGAMVMQRSTVASAGMTMVMGGQTIADGSFAVSGVPPGDHSIDVPMWPACDPLRMTAPIVGRRWPLERHGGR
jgi:protocatechuate 3,4-dioxygenase beta subunit